MPTQPFGPARVLSSENALWSLDAFRETPAHGLLSRTPMGFVDIGARGGVHDLVAAAAAGVQALCFEPDAKAAAEMERWARSGPFAAIEVEPVALDDRSGTSTLHLLSAATNHSLLPPNEPLTDRYAMVKFEKVGETPVRTATLDDILFDGRASNAEWGEFVKLDTQGTELRILRGGERCLRDRTLAVFSEVEFCPIYEGQDLFSDMEVWLRGLGFSFYGFANDFRRSRKRLDKRIEAGRERALHADAVFLKDPLAGSPVAFDPTERQVAVLFVCAILLGFLEFALELADAYWTPSERAAAREVIAIVAAVDPRETAAAVRRLNDRIASDPDSANIHLGKFIDANRPWCDYMDVPAPDADRDGDGATRLND